MSKALKKAFNITQWNDLGLNYWGIPKCGNTSVKYALLEKVNIANSDHSDTQQWVHNLDIAEYISRETAKKNGNANFATIRNPYERVKSLYKDFGIRRADTKIMKDVESHRLKDLDYFLEHYIKQSTDANNIHLRSLSYFLVKDGNVLIDNVIDINNINNFLSKYYITVPVLNTTQDLDIEFTDKQKQIIYSRYHQDFEIFGYDPCF